MALQPPPHRPLTERTSAACAMVDASGAPVTRLILPLALLAACSGPTDDDTDATAMTGLDADGDGKWDGASVDWSAQASIPAGTNRADVYGLGTRLDGVRDDGLGHASVWPIDVSGLLLPDRPMRALFADDATDGQTKTLQNFARTALGFGNLTEMFSWLGLSPYNDDADATGAFRTPRPPGAAEDDPMGVGVVDTEWGPAMTFSCATCHTASVFGKTVVGLTNRHARANEFFHLATGFFPDITPQTFGTLTAATEDELTLFSRTQGNLPAVGAVTPQVLGLDTALAQVSLSLSRRAEDGWASRVQDLESSPRPNGLTTLVGDSKPAVWWGLKYKTRWLSDGSVVSGNPVFTNFLWNEVGRATDLRELDTWLVDNQRIIDELTVAVFATTPPVWSDIFPDVAIDEDAAKRGEAVFQQRCQSCHGTYEKGWGQADADALSPEARVRTVSVTYHSQTPVMDVGTDPQRAQAMETFADALNGLVISQNNGTAVEVQTGYVPPPLDGVWLRYPYLHNGSVPTLCDLLTPAAERTVAFTMGPSDDPETDFDATCIGLPTGDAIPDVWKEDRDAAFDTTVPGLSNMGHDEMLGSGEDAITEDERMDLIEFLKTL